MDDILDYEAGDATLGKPGGADLQLGLATGPALFAWEEHPEMGPLIQRKFEQPGDVELVCHFHMLDGYVLVADVCSPPPSRQGISSGDRLV